MTNEKHDEVSELINIVEGVGLDTYYIFKDAVCFLF